MKRTIIESPFGTRPDGTRASPEELAENVRYLKRCLLDSLQRGEAPYASHAIYPQVLEDATPEEREMGIQAGFAWGAVADEVVVYADRGITPGMKRGIERALREGELIFYRYLDAKEHEEEAWRNQ